MEKGGEMKKFIFLTFLFIILIYNFVLNKDDVSEKGLKNVLIEKYEDLGIKNLWEGKKDSINETKDTNYEYNDDTVKKIEEKIEVTVDNENWKKDFKLLINKEVLVFNEWFKVTRVDNDVVFIDYGGAEVMISAEDIKAVK